MWQRPGVEEASRCDLPFVVGSGPGSGEFFGPQILWAFEQKNTKKSRDLSKKGYRGVLPTNKWGLDGT